MILAYFYYILKLNFAYIFALKTINHILVLELDEKEFARLWNLALNVTGNKAIVSLSSVDRVPL